MNDPSSKLIRYMISALLPYFLMRYFFPESVKKSDDKKLSPTVWKRLRNRAVENRAFKVAVFSLMLTIIWDDSGTSLVKILSGSSPTLSPTLFEETAKTNTTSTIEQIIKLSSDLQAAGIPKEVVEELNRKSLPKGLRFQFIIAGLKRSIKRLFKISNGNVRLFWLALILWLSNSCLGFSAILFAIRQMIQEGELPPDILDP